VDEINRAHAELVRQRHAWFERFDGVYTGLWWVPAGHVPGIDEAKQRLTFKEVFQLDEQFQRGIDWLSFKPCPAV
jgi:hypothetical protein